MSICQDHERLWLAQGKKSSVDKDFLDPYALYGFFTDVTSERNYKRRAKSAVAHTTSHFDPTIHRNHGHPPGYKTPEFHVGNPKNPTPTPATSRPASCKSGCSSARSLKMDMTSPTAFYLGSQRSRCKSAPPKSPRYIPKRPQTSKASNRRASASSSIRSAPQRAWELRNTSTTNCRSLLSPKEVQKRQQERCKSAPLPYDFSQVKLVTEIPENGTNYERLQAMTKPLVCMPNVIKNAVTHNGLRHCCSAFSTRTNMTPETRHQFWPVPRPAVYHRRGFVPEYFSFIKPLNMSKENKPPTLTISPTDDDQNSNLYDVNEDLDEEIIFEESFTYPETPSELSLSEKYDPSDDELDVVDNIVSEYLQTGIVSDPENYDDSLSPLPYQPDTNSNHEKVTETITEDQVPEIEVIITNEREVVVSPEPETPEPEYQEPEVFQEKEEKERDEEKETRLPGESTPLLTEDQQLQAAKEESEEEGTVEEPSVSFKPEYIPEDLHAEEEPKREEPKKDPEREEPKPEEEPKTCTTISNPATPTVTFAADSFKVTSYKSPEKKLEEPIKPILKPSKPPTQIMEEKPLPVKKPKPRPLVERREADLRPQIKPEIILKPEPPKVEEEKQEEKVEEPQPLEEKLPEPEFVHAPGAYRMYQPVGLAQHEVEKAKRIKKTDMQSSSTMPLSYMTGFSGNHYRFPESNSVIHSIMDDEKRKRGMKPWLQGRLALSKQTSRFELPMDVKVLETMTAMEYLTKYCIISTRRKTLYKHVFKKVDKDRDGIISFRELDKGLREIHVESIDIKEVHNIMQMIGADDKTKFNMNQFSAIAAFSERILFSNFVTEETKTINSTKEIVEEADFCSLKSKLDGCNVNPTVRKILESL